MSAFAEADLTGAADLTVTDIGRRFGPIPIWRVRTHPAPGTATEADVIRIHDREGRLCELIDGILLEKAVGYEESMLALAIGAALRRYVRHRRLGVVAGEGGTLKFSSRRVYIPDVSFISFESMPGGKRPRAPIPSLIPDLAVEVLSVSNTRKEIRRKLSDYFRRGVKLAWVVDPRQRTVETHTSLRSRTLLSESATLTGGDVLPGFKLKLRDLFAELDES